MDDVFGEDIRQRRVRQEQVWFLVRVLTIEQRSEKPVELRGFEPLTFCMPCSTVSSDGVVLHPVTALQSRFSVWIRLVRFDGVWGRWDLVWSWLPTLGSREVRLREWESPTTRRL